MLCAEVIGSGQDDMPWIVDAPVTFEDQALVRSKDIDRVFFVISTDRVGLPSLAGESDQ